MYRVGLTVHTRTSSYGKVILNLSFRFGNIITSDGTSNQSLPHHFQRPRNCPELSYTLPSLLTRPV
jgi:hypothetical protein